jgi:hypothetical protein
MLNITHATDHQHFGAHSGEIDSHLPAEVSQSFNYQMLCRTLMADSDVPDALAAARAINSSHAGASGSVNETTAHLASTTNSQPSAVVDAAVRSLDFIEVIQQRELNLQLNINGVPKKTDPLALDLAGNGFSSRGLSDSISFDLDGDGQLERINATSGDDVLLALGRNTNGGIDNSRELFGDPHGASNGFAERSKYDDDNDGRGDLHDSVFAHLSLMRFDQHGQQHSQNLNAADVSAIDLHAQNIKQALGTYDEIAQFRHFQFSDGRSGQAADLLLASH